MLSSPVTVQFVLETEFMIWMAQDTVPTLSVKYGVTLYYLHINKQDNTPLETRHHPVINRIPSRNKQPGYHPAISNQDTIPP